MKYIDHFFKNMFFRKNRFSVPIGKSVLFLSLFSSLVCYLLFHPPLAQAASLINASATLGNSRLSFRAAVQEAVEQGFSPIVQIVPSDLEPNQDTTNLFTNDIVCFVDSEDKGCEENTYKIGKIIDKSTFTLQSALDTDLSVYNRAVASQTGRLSVSFTTVSSIEENGYFEILLPPVQTVKNPNDSVADSNTQTANSGFDLNSLTKTDISIQGCSNEDWDEAEIESANAVRSHRIRILRKNSICQAGSKIIVSIDNSPGIVNPAPLLGSHTQGKADIYPITINTYDALATKLDTVDVKVGQIEPVQVSATVGEYRFSLYGYTSPDALVTLEGLGIFDQTKSDETGFFSFENRFSPLSPREACISSQDTLGRLTTPVCLAAFPIEKDVNIGPVVLPPTISFNRDYYLIGQEVIMTGQAVPNSEVDLSYFSDDNRDALTLNKIDKILTKALSFISTVEAYSLPKLNTKSDERGNYSISMQNYKPNLFRTFSRVLFQKEYSSKSNTLYLKIYPWWYIFIEFLIWLWALFKPYLLGIFIILQLIILSLFLLRKYLHPYPIAKNRALVLRAHYDLVMQEKVRPYK